MKTKIVAGLVMILALLGWPFSIQAETRKARLYSYVTKKHVMPIVFAKAQANVIIERRGIAEFENGEMAICIMRGAGVGSPKGGYLEGFFSTFLVITQQKLLNGSHS